MNTNFRFRGSAICLGLVLATALGVQSLVAAEPKPASPAEAVRLHQPMIGAKLASDIGLAGQVPADVLGNITTTTFGQIFGLSPSSQPHALFSRIRHGDHSGDQ